MGLGGRGLFPHFGAYTALAASKLVPLGTLPVFFGSTHDTAQQTPKASELLLLLEAAC